MVDEADIDMVGATSSASKGGIKRISAPSDGGGSPASRPPPNKRKPGPIPKDVTVKRPSKSAASSPASSPSSSPIPWMEDTKPPILAPPNLSVICNANFDLPSAPSSPYPNSPEKLVNGISEMPTIPVFEPIPVESLTSNHSDTPPILTPVINNVDVPKHEVKLERTDTELECTKLTVNDSVASQNSVKVKCVVEDPLMNHVEENMEKEKIEKERPLTKKEIEDIRKHNLSVRELVYREVRRKGTSK